MVEGTSGLVVSSAYRALTQAFQAFPLSLLADPSSPNLLGDSKGKSGLVLEEGTTGTGRGRNPGSDSAWIHQTCAPIS